MSLIPKDLTSVLQATALRGAGAIRWQRPLYRDLMPPCNHACPAGENIQAWLAEAQAGRYREAWLKYMEENPLPATHGRACYHPCESVCNRAQLDAPVAIHAIDRFLGDLASREGWTVPAMREAEAYDGPSLILAYSQCIAHGTDMRYGMKQSARAVAAGHWPLYRYDPTMRRHGTNPFRLDSPRPRLLLEDYRYREVRFKVIEQTRPAAARRMLEQARAAVMERYRFYEDLAARDGSRFEQAEPGR